MPVSRRHVIRPGDKFAKVYLGHLYTCEAKVVGTGLGFELPDGRQFRTLSSAGKAAVNRKGYEINGYVWWNRAEDMPMSRGPKVGSHRTPHSVEPVAAVEGVKAVTPVEPVGGLKPVRSKRAKAVLPVVAAREQAAEATPPPPRLIKNIRLSAEQTKVPRGQKRFFCLACNANFTTREAQPAQCPHGHPAKLQADLITEAAKQALA